jgi:hypothetical protein
MTTIAKHSGQNTGGILSVEYAFPNEFAGFVIYPAYKIKATFLNPGNWKTLYATATTFSGGGNSETTPSGILYHYDFKFRCPKDRSDLIEAFHLFQTTGVILRVTDGNSLKRIYGTPSNPLTVKSKLLLPGEVQGYNGYEIAMEGSFPDPAYLEQ